MNRSYQVRSFSMLGVGAMMALSAFVISGEKSDLAEAQQQEIFLEWSDGPESCPDPIPAPPDCATWHEIAPSYCVERHQDGYEDDGDGVASAGDFIVLNGIRYSINSAGPVVYLDCAGGTRVIAPISGTLPNMDVTKASWIELYPTLGTIIGSIREAGTREAAGRLEVCDEVVIGTTTCHVKRIGCDFRVVLPASSSEPVSWGSIKGIFGRGDAEGS